MRSKVGLIVVLIILLLWGSSSTLELRSQPITSTPILPFPQVQPGMKGIGKTVVRGTTIEDFFVEVIDVIEGPQLLNSFILVRASGKAIEESGGISQGMSGSPVYVDGKLIGAISMAAAWAVPQDALALVTPIESMLELLGLGEGWAQAGEELATAAQAQYSNSVPVQSCLGIIQELHFVSTLPDETELARQPHVLFAKELGSLVFVSGLRARGFILLTQGPHPEDVRVLRPIAELPLPLLLDQIIRFRLGDEGLTFMESGVAGSRWQATRDLKPGSALAVLLSKGDVTLTSIGTVTFVEDNKLLAFGHPFMFKGPAQYFLTGAFIYTTFRTLEVPFKYGAPDAVVLGTIKEDRAQGLAGLLGEEPEQVALRIRVRDPDRHSEKVFNIDLVEMADLLPTLILSAVTNSLDLALNRVSGGTVRADYTIRLVKDSTPLSVLRHDVFFDFQDVALAPALQISQIVANLALNPFQSVDLKEILVDMEFREGPRVAEVASLETDKDIYQPGEQVHFKVVLRPFRGSPFSLEGDFQLSEELKEGEITLKVIGGRVPGEEPSIASVEELVQAISNSSSNNQITLKVADSIIALHLDSWFAKGSASKEIKIQTKRG
jgi:hypothetical protein